MRTSKVEEKPRVWYPDSQVKRVFTEDRATSMAHVKSRWEPRTGFSNTEVTLEVLAKHKQERDTSEMNSHAESRSLCLHVFKATGLERRWQTQQSPSLRTPLLLSRELLLLEEKDLGKKVEGISGNVCHPPYVSSGGCSTRSDCHELWYVISFFVVFENRHRRYGR